jgi:hypothetical protein
LKKIRDDRRSLTDDIQLGEISSSEGVLPKEILGQSLLTKRPVPTGIASLSFFVMERRFCVPYKIVLFFLCTGPFLSMADSQRAVSFWFPPTVLAPTPICSVQHTGTGIPETGRFLRNIGTMYKTVFSISIFIMVKKNYDIYHKNSRNLTGIFQICFAVLTVYHYD